MRHYPIFLDLAGKRVLISGAGETALAKLRLLQKTDAVIELYAQDPEPALAAQAGPSLIPRQITLADLIGATLVYAANDDPHEDGQVAAIARQADVLVNVVDTLEASDFITPAIVDRDPVTVAIGTEGTAPVLARQIKSDIEAALPTALGRMARLAAGFRDRAAALPMGPARRKFWSRFFFAEGAAAFATGGEAGARDSLETLLHDEISAIAAPGRVAIVGAGPGDPNLMTRRGQALLHDADVVIHDRLVSDDLLELARREAKIISVGKTGFGTSWTQDDINAEIISHVADGQLVVRLKGGDPAIYARLDEEVAALTAAGIAFEVVPGITSASAAAASLGVSLTRRGRNSALRILTGHDVNGFTEQDWRGLSAPGVAAAIYMGKRAARFISGRLLMHGADSHTIVTAIENVSRPDQTIIETTVANLPTDLHANAGDGPVILLLGIARPKQSLIRHITKEATA